MFFIAYAELTSMMEYSLSRDSHFKALHEILQQTSVQPQAVSLAIDLLKVLGKAEENLGTATNQPVVHLARTCMADINMACVYPVVRIRGLLQTLGSRYPLELDTAIARVLNKANKPSSQATAASDAMDVSDTQQQLVERVHAAFRGTRHQPLVHSKKSSSKRRDSSGVVPTETLFLSLQHADEQVRLLAIQQLENNMSQDADNAELREFYGDSLLARLREDDSPAVLAAALKAEFLHEAVRPKILFGTLETLFARQAVSDRLRASILRLLFSKVLPADESLRDSLFSFLFPYLFIAHQGRRLGSAALSSAESLQHPLLQGIEQFAEQARDKETNVDQVCALCAPASSFDYLLTHCERIAQYRDHLAHGQEYGSRFKSSSL